MSRESVKSDSVYPLSDEERASVRAGMDAARRGNSASDEEMDEFYRLHSRQHRHSGARA